MIIPSASKTLHATEGVLAVGSWFAGVWLRPWRRPQPPENDKAPRAPHSHGVLVSTEQLALAIRPHHRQVVDADRPHGAAAISASARTGKVNAFQ